MKIKYKKLSKDAVAPNRAHLTDAGFDLTCTRIVYGGDYISYGTGLAFEIPEGHVGLLFPRSSIFKKDLVLSNSVGVIDSGYRGEVMFKFRCFEGGRAYEVGDRIGQLIVVPYPAVEYEEVDELSDSDRGEGGYGSTGN